MLIITIIISLVILLIHLYIGYTIYKGNKKIFCIFLSALFAISYIAVGCFLYKNAAVFPMSIMLITTFVFGGVWAASKPEIKNIKNNVSSNNYSGVKVITDSSIIENRRDQVENTSYTLVYNSFSLYGQLLLISVIGVLINLFLFSASSNSMSAEDAKRFQVLQKSCELMIKDSFGAGSSVVIHSLIGSSYYKAPANGNEVISLDFDLKDMYGKKERYKARCLYPSDEKPEVSFAKIGR